MNEEYINYLLEKIEDIIVISNFLKQSLNNKKDKEKLDEMIDTAINHSEQDVLPSLEDYNSLVIENHILKNRLGIGSSFTNYCFKGDDT